MNRILKRIIKVKQGRKNVIISELATLLTITEGIVNSRQLAITRDTDDQKIITPAILAINKNIKSIPPYKCDKYLNIPQLRSCKDVNRRRKYLDFLHTQLWRKWVEVQWVKVHRSNLTKGRPLQAGDVFLIRDTTLQVRGRYPLGVVETAKESRTNDNIVRSAIIRIPPIDERKEILFDYEPRSYKKD